MTEITVSFPEDSLAKLRELAAVHGISAEELVRARIDQLLDRSEEEFKRVADYVLKKNKELCQRLA